MYLFLISKSLLKGIKINLILNDVRQDLFCEFVPLTLLNVTWYPFYHLPSIIQNSSSGFKHYYKYKQTP